MRAGKPARTVLRNDGTPAASLRQRCGCVGCPLVKVRVGDWRGRSGEGRSPPPPASAGHRETGIGSPTGEETFHDGELSGHPDCPRVEVATRSRESHLAAPGELTFPASGSAACPSYGGNDTLCDGRVNGEDSDNALPVDGCRKCQEMKWFGRERMAPHPRSRGNRTWLAQKVYAAATRRNRLRVRELGTLRGAGLGSEKKKCRCAKKEKCLRLCRVGRPSGTR